MAKKEWIKVGKLPEYVKKIRKKKDVTQEEAARAVAITQPHISRTENPDEGTRLTLINDLLVMIAGTAIDFEDIRVPIRAATVEDHESARERMEKRLNGEYIGYNNPKIGGEADR